MHHSCEMVVFIFPVQEKDIFKGLKNPFRLSKGDKWNGFYTGIVVLTIMNYQLYIFSVSSNFTFNALDMSASKGFYFATQFEVPANCLVG